MIDTTPNLVLILIIGAFFVSGVYLLLERSLTRVLLGFILMGNGANLIFLVAGGRAGTPPLLGQSEVQEMSDPLPQAMVLTAIVITLGLTAFILSMAYRSWQLNKHDEVQDDLEDRRIARIAAQNSPAYRDADASDSIESIDDQAAQARDETGEGAS